MGRFGGGRRRRLEQQGGGHRYGGRNGAGRRALLAERFDDDVLEWRDCAEHREPTADAFCGRLAGRRVWRAPAFPEASARLRRRAARASSRDRPPA